MGKAEIRASISYYRDQKSNLEGKIAKLRNARINLYGVSTSIKYVLTSHEHIKSQYHLAGTPYLEMTNEEENLLGQMKTYFNTQQEFFLDEIDRKIAHHESGIASYDRTIYMLQQALAVAED